MLLPLIHDVNSEYEGLVFGDTQVSYGCHYLHMHHINTSEVKVIHIYKGIEEIEHHEI